MKPSARDPDLTELASKFTVRDYKAARDAKQRERIAEGIRRRFTERYITPALDPPKRNGFTMMAISCLMIEAFMSLRKGWKTSNGKGEAAVCCFFDGADLFKEFRGHGQAFYKNVRCGILHQAETTGGWKIVRSGPLFDPGTDTINAARFLPNLKQVLDDFCDGLKTAAWDGPEWKNVCKKMNGICENCTKSLKPPRGPGQKPPTQASAESPAKPKGKA